MYTMKDSVDARDRMLASRIGELASRFGRRLTVGSIGFADPSEEFSTLQAMTEACAEYGCQATFHKPSLNCGVSSEHLVKLIVDPHDDEDGAHRIGWLKTAHCS